MSAQEVGILFDTYRGRSPRRCFRLLRISFIETSGCREFDTLLKTPLIVRGIAD
jgi:hypothetical protein